MFRIHMLNYLYTYMCMDGSSSTSYKGREVFRGGTGKVLIGGFLLVRNSKVKSRTPRGLPRNPRTDTGPHRRTRLRDGPRVSDPSCRRPTVRTTTGPTTNTVTTTTRCNSGRRWTDTRSSCYGPSRRSTDGNGRGCRWSGRRRTRSPGSLIPTVP